MFSGIGGFELGIRQAETKSIDSTDGEGRASQMPRRRNKTRERFQSLANPPERGEG